MARRSRKKWNIKSVYLIGLGGTGSALIEPLTRLLMNHKNGTWDIVLIDGDDYEEHNTDRQMFDKQYVGLNKAEATCKRYSYFPNLSYINTYISPSNLQLLIPLDSDINEITIVISAVDNLATRKALIDHLTNSIGSFIMINPGNTTDKSMCHVWGHVGNTMLGPHPFDLMLELKYPNDHIPTPGGCLEEAVYTPQLITANWWAASLVIANMNCILDGKPIYPLLFSSFYELKINSPIGDPFVAIKW